jgi:trehalose-phosphatase
VTRTATTAELAERLRGTPLLLMLDIDGTLCEIVERPDEARVPERTQQLLGRLVERPGVCIAIVTGRAAADARRMVDIEGMHIVANHGLEHWGPDGEERTAPGWERAARSVRAAVAELQRIPLDYPGASIEDKHFTISVHFRQTDDTLIPALQRDVSAIADRHALRVAGGKQVINVLPPLGVNKGDAALALVRECAAAHDGASVFFAGDDLTDEDAFAALAAHVPSAVTVRIGDDGISTAAAFRVASPNALVDVLERVERERA